MPEKLVPLNHVRSDRFGINVDLPLPLENGRVLAIRQDIVEELCQLAGIEHLSILEKGRDDFVPAIAGVDENGNASRGVSAVGFDKIETDFGWKFKCCTWRRETIELDMKELVRRVSKRDSGVHSLDNFADALNKDLVAQIRKRGRISLLMPNIKDIGFDLSVAAVHFLANQATWNYKAMLGTFAFDQVAKLIASTGSNNGIRLEISCIGGVEILRLLVWETMTWRMRIFEVMEEVVEIGEEVVT